MDASGCYYAILEVDSSADDAAIRLAYRKLMRRYHPDINRAEEAVAQAKAINQAYACLRDPDGRAAYDRERAAPRAAPMPDFTAARRSPPRGAHWQPPRPRPTVVEVEPPHGGLRAGILGLAVLITFVTFALTSASPPAPPPPPPVIVDGVAVAADKAG